MKKIIILLALTFCVQSVMAITVEQHQEVLGQLEAARVEISSVNNLLPSFLRKTLGENLRSADERITRVQQILAVTSVGST